MTEERVNIAGGRDQDKKEESQRTENRGMQPAAGTTTVTGGRKNG